MKKANCLSWILLFMLVKTAFAGSLSEIQNAIDAYGQDKPRAIGILEGLYQKNGNLFEIKSILMEKQSYSLYQDFLHHLPLKRETADEIMNIRFLTGSYENFLIDYKNYLGYFTVRNAVDRYSSGIASPDFISNVRNDLSDQELFLLLKNSYMKTSRIGLFDKVLSENTDIITNWAPVKQYILESWQISQRDVKALLEKYLVPADPAINQIRIASEFISGGYSNTLRMNEEFNSGTNDYPYFQKLLHIDMPYMLSYSYLRTAQYGKALNLSPSFYYQSPSDTARFRFLCLIALKDWQGADRELKNISDKPVHEFYEEMLRLQSGGTNAIQLMENSMAIVNGQRRFIPEMSLLVYTFYKYPSELNTALQAVWDSLVQRELEIFPKNPVLASFSADRGGANPSNLSAGPSLDFNRLRKAMEYRDQGKPDQAKEMLFRLIQSKDTSPLIKSMAIYQSRKE